MTMEMDWSPDFCLACDCQTTGEVYCSQSCRLADIEKATPASESVSPATPSRLSSWPESSRASGFYLAPAVNFDLYRSSPSSRSLAWSSPKTGLSDRGQSLSTSRSTILPRPTLTPSSSNSSLASMGSSMVQREVGYLSDQAREELRGYASSFDRVRDWKRRITWG